MKWADLTNAIEHAHSLVDSDPELRAEYDRLGPRYEAISALIGARKKANVSQAELAKRMGVSQSVVSRLLSAEHSPRLDTLAEAAKAMGYRLDVRFVKERPVTYSTDAPKRAKPEAEQTATRPARRSKTKPARQRS